MKHKEIVVALVTGCTSCQGMLKTKTAKVPANSDQVRCLGCGKLWRLDHDKAGHPILLPEKES